MKNLQKDSVQNGDQMTLFSQVDFPASHTALQESGSEKTTLDTFGRKCLESFEKLSRHGSWAKTFAALLVGTGEWYSTKCNLTWKLSATKSSRLFFQLAPSTHRIDATGFGLLPTATSVQRDHPERVMGLIQKGAQTMMSRKNGENRPNSILDGVMFYSLLKTPTTADAYSENLTKKEQRMGNIGTLAQEIQSGFVENRWPGLLPTPTAFDYNSARTPEKFEQDKAKYAEQGVNLQLALKQMAVNGLLPTPTSNDSKNATLPDSQAKRDGGLVKHFHHLKTGTTSQLNPQFVCEMMGFPPNWLELPFLNTETNQSKPTGTQ
jgi:hypothetical protein